MKNYGFLKTKFNTWMVWCYPLVIECNQKGVIFSLSRFGSMRKWQELSVYWKPFKIERKSY